MHKVGILFDKQNNWIEKYINKNTFKNNKKYKFYFLNNLKKFKNFDITFILGFTKIINRNILKKNKLNFVIHESNLPKGRGFSPVQVQILDGKTKIPICLIAANQSKVDTGNIFLKDYFYIKDTYLYDDIRKSQGNATKQLIKKFLSTFPRVKEEKQKGKSSYFKKRTHLMSEININKSIKNQFNLLRICNNEKWPAFFKFKGKKFILKIYKCN